MGRRSLFASLDFSNSASRDFVESQRGALSDYIRFDLLTYVPPTDNPLPIRVAVVGGGFAGLAAASTLQNLQAQVTLFEARADIGGRVSSMTMSPNGPGRTTSNIPGQTPMPRILERGAELIGRNHPAWIRLAEDLGLGLSVLTTDDLYDGMALQPRLRMGGKDLSQAEIKAVDADMRKVIAKLVNVAETAYGVLKPPPRPQSSAGFKKFEPWYEPWKIPWASRYDGQSLGAWINDNTSSNPRSKVRAAIRYGFANDMAIDVDKLSLLAMLTHIAGGGFGRYWDDTEVYRCEDGNQALAAKLGERLSEGCPPATVLLREAVTAIRASATGVTVTSRHTELTTQGPLQGPPRDSSFDYLVLAVPSTVWSGIDTGGTWQLPKPMQSGPAVKYLAFDIPSRYWIEQGFAPSGNDDQLGQLWESTDNQMGGTNVGLSVFAGGPYATTALQKNPDSYFQAGMEKLMPGAKKNVTKGVFSAWPTEPYIMTGYCAPAVGEVIGLQQQMQGRFGPGERIFLAGEETCAPFFGFMEGALQSGIKAAERVLDRAGIKPPAAPRPGEAKRVRRKCRGLTV